MNALEILVDKMQNVSTVLAVILASVDQISLVIHIHLVLVSKFVKNLIIWKSEYILSLFGISLNFVLNYSCFFYSDVNECTSMSRPCGINAICENAVPGYNCVCPPGFNPKPTAQIACEQVSIWFNLCLNWEYLFIDIWRHIRQMGITPIQIIS